MRQTCGSLGRGDSRDLDGDSGIELFEIHCLAFANHRDMDGMKTRWSSRDRTAERGVGCMDDCTDASQPNGHFIQTCYRIETRPVDVQMMIDLNDGRDRGCLIGQPLEVTDRRSDTMSEISIDTDLNLEDHNSFRCGDEQ